MNRLRGTVVKGIGKGQYYVSREGYSKQFIRKLGFDPSPGTLNLVIAEPLSEQPAKCIEIEGFQDEKGMFGGCRCYKVMVGNIKGAIVRPERTRYPPNLVEIIAPVNLRKTLNLKDGDELEIILK